MDIKELATEAADAIIDRYLDVTDLADDIDITLLTSEAATNEFADEVAALIRKFVLDSVESASRVW